MTVEGWLIVDLRSWFDGDGVWVMDHGWMRDNWGAFNDERGWWLLN